MENINQLKLELIEYYESVKNKIDVKVQTRLMEPCQDAGSLDYNSDLIMSISNELTNKCDFILKKCIESINNSSTVLLQEADAAENIHSAILPCDCLFIQDLDSKLKILIKNGIGLLIVSDWYMHLNDKQFVLRLFTDGDQEPLGVEDERDIIEDDIDITKSPDDLQLDLTENLLLIKHAYENFEDMKYAKKPNILDMKRSILIDQNQRTSKFSLSGFHFKSIEQDAFVNCRNMTHLFLSGNKIKSLVANIFKHGLENLKTLDLFGCSIKTIEPNAFDGLSNLISLNLGHNSQIDLNDSAQFNGLTKLKILNLSDNDFKSDINELEIFSNLNNLIMLDLALCSLRNSIKSTLFTGLNRLETLDLTHCMITTIESNCFKNLVNLKTLDLQYNHFPYIDSKTFNGLNNLEKLHLQDCSIVKIESDAFIQQTELTDLNLSGNNTELLNEQSFNGLMNLKELSLNYMLDININAFVNLKNLQSLRFNVPPDLMPCRSPSEIAKVYNLDPSVVIEMKGVL